MNRAPRAVVTATALLWLALPLLPVALWAGADHWTFPAVLPQSWGLRGWRDGLGAGLPPALLRSLALGLVVSVLATPLGVMTGRALGWRLAGRPRGLIAVLLVPLVLPPFAVSMGLDVVLIRLRVPELVAVVALLVVVAIPYTAYTCAVGFARTPPALADQARALGATPGQASRRVVLPALRSSILVAALLAFLVGWSDYVITLLVGGGQLVTAPVLLGSTASGSGNEAAVAVMALATLAPPVLLVVLAARWRQSPGVGPTVAATGVPDAERIRP